MDRLAGKVAIVTGAAQGIGRAFCLGLAAAGAKVAAVDIQDEENRSVVEEITQSGGEAIAVHTDVSSPASTEAMAAATLDRFGRIDILVTCAAIYATLERSDFLDISLEEWDKDPAVRWVFVCCHHPPFTNSTVISGSGQVEREFVKPYLESRKALAFFSGHSHAYERFQHRGKWFIVSGGGGGPRHRVREGDGEKRQRDLFVGPNPRPFHYCKITVEDEKIHLRMIGLDPVAGEWSAGEEVQLTK